MRWFARAVAAIAGVAMLTACSGIVPTQPDPYPAAPGRWAKLPVSPLSARHEATGGWVDGRFILVGGWNGPVCGPNASCAKPDPALADGAAFDPVSGQWERIADAPRPIDIDNNAAVARGRLWLMTSDVDDSGSTEVEFLSYDPGRDAWTRHPAPPDPTSSLVAAGDRLLAVPYSDEQHKAVDAVFSPDTNRWTTLPDDPLGPGFDRGAVWIGDRLLLTSHDLVPNPGADGPSLARLAVLDPTSTRWTSVPDSGILGGGGEVWVGERVVFGGTGSADGGEVGNWGRPYPYGGIFDPATGAWASLPEPPKRSTGLEGFVGSVGARTLVGGHLLDPATREWTRLPTSPWGERTGQTAVTSPDAILVWGGATERSNVADGYLFRP